MSVLLSTYGSRGAVEPVAGPAARLRVPGAVARACAPPDLAGLLGRVGAPPAAGGMVPAGVRP